MSVRIDIAKVAPETRTMSRAGLVFRRLFSGVSSASLEQFYFQLATMLSSGITIREALYTLAGQWKGRPAAMLTEVADEVSGGRTLSESMDARPAVFSPLAIALVRTAEQTGRLDQNLALIARTMERHRRIRSRIITRLIYPLLLLHLAIFIPNILILIREGLLPFLLRSGVELLPIYVATIVFSFLHLVLRETRLYTEFLLSLFFIGPILRKLAFARFARALAALYDAGVPLSHAVDVAAEATANGAIRDPLKATSTKMQRGMSLSASVADLPHMPALVKDMIATGEHSGSLETTLRKVADYYDDEAEQAALRMAIVIPVVIYMGIVGWIAWKVISFYVDYYGPLLGA